MAYNLNPDTMMQQQNPSIRYGPQRSTYLIGVPAGYGQEIAPTLAASQRVLRTGDHQPEEGSLAAEVRDVQSAHGFFNHYRAEVVNTRPFPNNLQQPSQSPARSRNQKQPTKKSDSAPESRPDEEEKDDKGSSKKDGKK